MFRATKELWAASAALGESTSNLKRRKEIGILLEENLKMSINRAVYFENKADYEKAISVFKENLGRLKQLKYTTIGVKQLKWYEQAVSQCGKRIEYCEAEVSIRKVQTQV